MPRIIVAQFVTVDGVTEDPDGSGGTPFGGWALRHGPAAIAGDKFSYGGLLETGVFLFGRATWQFFSSMWPFRDDPFAQALNSADKAVAAHGDLDVSAWQNSRVIDGELADWATRTRAQRDVIVVGSASVVRQLESEDLVDEYRLRTFPTVAGSGRRLFTRQRELRLDSIETTGLTSLAIYTVIRS